MLASLPPLRYDGVVENIGMAGGTIVEMILEGTSEAAIFGRILEPGRASLSLAAAKSILALDFSQADRDRMHLLLVKAKQGTLSAAEEAEVDNYERVGHMISLMKSKARCSLKARRRKTRKAKVL